MLDFFIALFGALFYTGTVASEKLNKSIYKNNSTAIEKNIKDIGSSVELEEEIKKKLISGMNVEEVYDELYEDFKFVFGEDVNVAKILRLRSGIYAGRDLLSSHNRIYKWCYHLLLSHHGKVDTLSMGGFFIGGIRDVGGMRECDRDIRICQRIEYNLKQNGIDQNLYLKPKLVPESIKDKCDEWDPVGGVIVLESQLLDGRGKRLWY